MTKTRHPLPEYQHISGFVITIWNRTHAPQYAAKPTGSRNSNRFNTIAKIGKGDRAPLRRSGREENRHLLFYCLLGAPKNPGLEKRQQITSPWL